MSIHVTEIKLVIVQTGPPHGRAYKKGWLELHYNRAFMLDMLESRLYFSLRLKGRFLNQDTAIILVVDACGPRHEKACERV